MSLPRPVGVALPALPDTLAALRAMQSLLLAECLVGGVSPFAALPAADAARYGVANAVFVGRPKDFSDAWLPACCIALAPGSERVTLDGHAGRALAEWEADVLVLADLRADWYAAEQRVLAIRDALWPVLLRHDSLGGTVPTVAQADARPGHGLGYAEIAGVTYRAYTARWWVRQQWTLPGGRVG